jgi:hypothetical protein
MDGGRAGERSLARRLQRTARSGSRRRAWPAASTRARFPQRCDWPGGQRGRDAMLDEPQRTTLPGVHFAGRLSDRPKAEAHATREENVIRLDGSASAPAINAQAPLTARRWTRHRRGDVARVDLLPKVKPLSLMSDHIVPRLLRGVGCPRQQVGSASSKTRRRRPSPCPSHLVARLRARTE